MAIAQYRKKEQNYWYNQFKDSKKELWRAVKSKDVELILNYAKDSDTILEGGCATGRFLESLNFLGFNNVHGFELDNKLFRLCLDKKLSVKKGDILDIPFKDNFADVYLDIGLMEHFSFKKKKKILKEIHRVLKKKGVLLVDFAYLNNFRKLISPYMVLNNLNKKHKNYDFHQWIYTKRDMVNLLKKNGFKTVFFIHHIKPRAIIVSRKV